jgi:hypothetical protein
VPRNIERIVPKAQTPNEGAQLFRRPEGNESLELAKARAAPEGSRSKLRMDYDGLFRCRPPGQGGGVQAMSWRTIAAGRPPPGRAQGSGSRMGIARC